MSQSKPRVMVVEDDADLAGLLSKSSKRRATRPGPGRRPNRPSRLLMTLRAGPGDQRSAVCREWTAWHCSGISASGRRGQVC